MTVIPVLSMEMGEGVVKLVVNDITGRVAFYRLAEIGRNRYEPLLFDEDSRTTFASLSLDSRFFRLGDSVEFRFSLVRIDHGLVIYYKSTSCMVRQRIEFIKSQGSSIVDSFRMSFEIENTGNQDIRVGLRMLLDTSLGEKDGTHFSTGNRSKVTEETRFTKETAETSITSSGQNASLRIDLAGEGITPPDEIVLANWKRLSDSNWSFEASGLRGFSFAPFSINDSSVALFWYPENLPRYAVRKLSFAMVAMPGKAAAVKSSSDPAKTSSVPLMTAQPLPAQENQSPSAMTTPATLAESATPPSTAASASPAVVPVASAAAKPNTSDIPEPVLVASPQEPSASNPVPIAVPQAAEPNPSPIAPPAQATQVPAPANPPTVAASQPTSPALPSLRVSYEADLAELWELLGRINEGLANPASVSDAQMLEWRRRIAAIQARYNGK
jgi:hypothetical protein